jgi:hypothetical protein
MVTFLSKTVAGKAGLDGNGEISRVKVTCKQLQHNTSSAPALLGLEIGLSLMLLAAVTLLQLGLNSVPRLGYHIAHGDGQPGMLHAALPTASAVLTGRRSSLGRSTHIVTQQDLIYVG